MVRDDPPASSTASSTAAVLQAARRPQCVVKWDRNFKCQCTSITDRQTDRRTGIIRAKNHTFFRDLFCILYIHVYTLCYKVVCFALYSQKGGTKLMAVTQSNLDWLWKFLTLRFISYSLHLWYFFINTESRSMCHRYLLLLHERLSSVCHDKQVLHLCDYQTFLLKLNKLFWSTFSYKFAIM